MLTLMFASRRRVHLARFSGMVAWVDFEALDKAVIEFVARTGPVDAILDFSAAQTMAMPETRILNRGRTPQLMPGRRRILVVPTFEQQGLARLFVSEQTHLGATPPEIVSAIDDAFAALGVAEADFEPVGDQSH